MLRRKWLLLEEAQEGGDLPGGPAPQPEAAVNESEEDHGIDWGDITSADDGMMEEPEAVKAPEPTEDPDEALANAPAQEAEPAAQEALPPQPEIPQGVQFTPEQIAAAEQAYMKQLASFYAFDEDSAVQLQTEPEKILPQLAARLHVDVMKNVMAQMQGVLPQLVQQVQSVSTREAGAQDLFFKAWPELKGYDQQVLQVGKMYRQMNPNASPEEAVQRIGELAMTAMGMQRKSAQAMAAPAPQGAFRPSVPGRVSAPAPAGDFWGSMVEDEEY